MISAEDRPLRAENDSKGKKSIRELLADVKMGMDINRYQFSVIAARRAREVHALTSETETKSQQRSLSIAVSQIASGGFKTVREKEPDSAK
jgi:DNA-directed RNA polymerase subunit K/omega